MAKKIRALGIDDGFFTSGDKQTKLIGVIFRSDYCIEGILSEDIGIDALDSSELIVKMVKKSRFCSQIRYIFLSGINFAGFNIVDLPLLYSKLRIPIIVTMRRKPNLRKIYSALDKFQDSEKRKSLIEKAGSIIKHKNIYYQSISLSHKLAEHIIDTFTITSNMPEPIRLAHLIASGFTFGESTRF